MILLHKDPGREPMNHVFTMFFYALAVLLLILSFCKDQDKTRSGIQKGISMMLGVMPYFLTILLVTGTALNLLKPDTIRQILGAESGLRGMITAALAGTAALVPVLAVFPMVSELLKNGAGTAQMAIFISTLTTVGFITIPLEIKYLGVKAAVLRNILFFLAAFVTSYLLGVML